MRHLLRLSFIPTYLLLWTLLAGAAHAGDLGWSDVIRSSLIVRAIDDAAAPYPHRLRVYLILENVHDAEVTWVSEDPLAVDIEVLDEKGKPVPTPPISISVLSSKRVHRLPVGSRLEWLVSDQGGVGLWGDAAAHYALIAGARGWLLPREGFERYSLRLTLHGRLWSENTSYDDPRPLEKLLELPPAPLRLSEGKDK